jgi:hypothetical protein
MADQQVRKDRMLEYVRGYLSEAYSLAGQPSFPDEVYLAFTDLFHAVEYLYLYLKEEAECP